MHAKRQQLLSAVDFKHFAQLLRDSVFKSISCERALPRRARESLPMCEFRKEPSGEGSVRYSNVFGLERNGKGECFANAIPLVASPQCWKDYTGMPGYVPFDLFALRCWVAACGGLTSSNYLEWLTNACTWWRLPHWALTSARLISWRAHTTCEQFSGVVPPM